MANVNDLVAKYIKLRDRKAEMKAEFTKKTERIDNAIDLIEGHLLKMFNESGLSSVKTDAGTAYKSSRVTASVADWDTVLAFIRENDLWHMLERRVGKDAVKQYNEEHGALPPGVNMSEEITINVRR